MSNLDTGGNDDPICAAIDAAEEVRDLLEGLVERTAADPGAAFVPDVLECLMALKRDDRAAFEALRAQLKKAGCRVTALDDAIAEESGEGGGRGPTQADLLIDLAQSAELFHAPDGTGFADLDINGHRETWPIRAKGFRRWLARRFFDATVRFVRTVRRSAEAHSHQWFCVARLADGRRRCGRSQERQRPNRPRQPRAIQRRDRGGRCGRKSSAPFRAQQ